MLHGSPGQAATGALGNVPRVTREGLRPYLLLSILRRVRKGPGVIEDLGEVADVEVAAARGALEEVVGLGSVLAVDALADDLAAP